MLQRTSPSLTQVQNHSPYEGQRRIRLPKMAFTSAPPPEDTECRTNAGETRNP